MSYGNLVVMFNGHEVGHHATAADALEGWVEVADCYDRGQGEKFIRTDYPTNALITRRLYGDVTIRYRGIPLLRASAGH